MLLDLWTKMSLVPAIRLGHIILCQTEVCHDFTAQFSFMHWTSYQIYLVKCNKSKGIKLSASLTAIQVVQSLPFSVESSTSLEALYSPPFSVPHLILHRSPTIQTKPSNAVIFNFIPPPHVTKPNTSITCHIIISERGSSPVLLTWKEGGKSPYLNCLVFGLVNHVWEKSGYRTSVSFTSR